MLDIKVIREKNSIVKKSLEKRGLLDKIDIVDNVLSLDKRWRALKLRSDKLRNKRNDLTETIRTFKKEGKSIDLIITKAKEVPRKLDIIEKEMFALKEELNLNLSQIPNNLHSSVPKGNDENDNIPFKFYGTKPKYKFELKSHGDFLEESNLADFEKGRINVGQGFNYILGDLALMELALQRYGIDYLTKKGFKLVLPPLMLNKATLSGTVNMGEFEEVIYKLENEDLYLIGTGEHPLVALYRNKLFKKEELPIKLCTITPCFRKEIGSRGVDTKGLFRVHQFYKVEQVIISTEEDSNRYLEEMQKISEDFYKKLKIPYRVIEICSGDLGYNQSKQYDIEAWFPRQESYREITSASNTTSYQSNGLNIKYLDGEIKKPVHMLNNTLVATTRTMVAIIENFQKKEGTVIIPRPLRKYMSYKRKIGRNNK
jgi:seryl-tRNA synthetase